MMYNNKLVASIKVNGRILRENKDTVLIPFGSEYSILLKNLHTSKALVSVFIDGDNVVPGGLIVESGCDINLERWIKNGNMSEGNCFKFIERTAHIENSSRGIQLEDGLIRIEFQFEKPPIVYRHPTSWDTAFGTAFQNGPTTTYSTGILRSIDNNTTIIAQSASLNDIGITVPGSKSNQQFVTGHIGVLESEKHSIVFKLLGETADNTAVTNPVTVKQKLVCQTCGHTNKASAMYCNKCGTALVIYA